MHVHVTVLFVRLQSKYLIFFDKVYSRAQVYKES